VGTRNATDYGKELTERLITDLTPYGVTIVSGMAYGIDIFAHRQAVKQQLQTIAVMAHGLDRIYPAAHRPTAEKMLKQGGILTEYISKTNPDRENFPSRNRIVAGMCDATVVIESGIKGGALITAEIANSYNRDVFAFPGRVSDEYSLGCNELIRKNKAMLVQTANELAEVMQWKVEEQKPMDKKKQLRIFHELKEDEKVLVSILQQNGKTDIDTLTLHAKMPVSKVSTTLLNLEFAGVLKALPGKLFELV
jgi:DNA processing protein